MKIKSCRYTDTEAILYEENARYILQAVKENIIRCVYTKNECVSNDSLIVVPLEKTPPAWEVLETDQDIIFSTVRVQLIINRETGNFTWYDKVSGKIYLQENGKSLVSVDVIKYTTGGEPPVVERVKTVDGERNFIKNLQPEVDRKSFRGKLNFCFKDGEGIFGLGQGEEGIYNYRGHYQYLYQHNMRIPVPAFLSTECYSILFDCCSLMTFRDDPNGSYVFLDTADQLDYYFMAGSCLDDLIDANRSLTGTAAMLPKWSFGYIQSKEAYHTGKELEETAAGYRRRGVPLDCVVQDWNTWAPGSWGEKIVDETRYPDLKSTNERIHQMNVHTMVSIWPNMNAGGRNHEELFHAGHLLNDYSTYNAFSEEARRVYWKQAEAGLFLNGFDSWWCDSTEPFSGPDWGGEEKREPWERYEMVGNEHKKYLDPAFANAFALEHAKGIFENQRQTTREKRVLNLTRSGYSGSQRYGTVLWSGDTCASWSNFRKQITEGLNFAMSGLPYWTLDIGAFFTVGSDWQKRGCNNSDNSNPLWFWQGDYNDGVKDNAYCELYVRWLQYGTFLPMFRSHGTDTPREIWQFGEKGSVYYDSIEKFIRLRYGLMPYIYSLAGEVTLRNGTMLRSLLFDFLEDKNCRYIDDEFMFGPSILVCPVIEPMYYEAGNRPIESEKIRSCYLPAGTVWTDFWTGKIYEGGTVAAAFAPIDRIPLFIKAGSIIPMIRGLQFADEDVKEPVELRIYTGADAGFMLYEDEGDNYNYEDGFYAVTEFIWEDQYHRLTIKERKGSYPGMKEKRIFRLIAGSRVTEVDYCGDELQVTLFS